METAPTWLVASVSEALCRPSASAVVPVASSHAIGLASPNKPWFFRPSSFSHHGRGQQVLESWHQSQPSISGFSPSIGSFRVLGRRQAFCSFVLPPELDIHALDLDIDPATIISSQATSLINTLKYHLLPKVSLVMAAQRQCMAQFDRAGRWLGSRRLKGGDNEPCSSSRCGFSSSRQESTFRANEVLRLTTQAQQAEQQANPELAAELYAQLVTLAPTSDNYARLSKQYSDSTYMGIVSRERVVELNTKAVELAGIAVEADPTACMGHIARCVSRGRLALVSDNRTKIQLAKDAADDAMMALQCDSQSDLAHHLMGRWHYEMAQINAVARYLIKVFFGTSLMQGTFQESLMHYKTAAELCPKRVIHRVEIGRTLMKLGDTKGAAEEFKKAVDMEIEDINALLQREDAATMLQKLQGSGKLGIFLLGPQAKAGVHGSAAASGRTGSATH